eukprot:5257820-Alexandrium_andersonii.AAC.1
MAPMCSRRSRSWWRPRWVPTCTDASSAVSLSGAAAFCTPDVSTPLMPASRRASAGHQLQSALPSGAAGAGSTGRLSR